MEKVISSGIHPDFDNKLELSGLHNLELEVMDLSVSMPELSFSGHSLELHACQRDSFSWWHSARTLWFFLGENDDERTKSEKKSEKETW